MTWPRRASSLPPPWAPWAAFGVIATVLVPAVLGLVRAPGPLDQPDPSRQRDGLVDEGPAVPTSVQGVRFGGEVVVLLFVRQEPEQAVVEDWSGQLPHSTRVEVVVQAPEAEVEPWTADPQESLAEAVDLPTPVDGGPGVGYAVVDEDRLVRYATLDPAWRSNAYEAATIAGAVA